MAQNSDITIVDSGMGNLRSVCRKFERIGVSTTVTCDPAIVAKAGKLVLPGVGHFKRAMTTLEELGLADALREAVELRKTPVLGICLGMQLMARHSEEGDVAGFGWLDADVVRFRVEDFRRFKIPHMGWNEVAIAKESPLLKGVPANAEFYFTHAYRFEPDSNEQTIGETDYEYRFVSAVAKEHVFGTQFHPEKSYGAGDTLLKNFAEI